MMEVVPATHGSYYPTTNHCVNNNIGKVLFGKGTQLYVQAKQKKDPEFYKLQDSCLATDFTDHSAVNSSHATVRYSGKDYQNYYSNFAFGGGDDCQEKDSCRGSSSESGDIEKDEKINFLSLGLFWLRILFLKTVVFNVLMTFKAWMS
ncbi:M1-specific T cell receptor alpha chain-like [Rhinichthys klamathensis goyatoka]|uniref:M1-specific T cell receptor alpha chain-like n=1 Tax=Rhinichthys klamathensis goyatoka TaxID=3034132 RepID=UPI0024B4EC4C|nr:M1-specific T cell receptor alpha chain-like [Rhinichthys klamathensis goyatoka]